MCLRSMIVLKVLVVVVPCHFFHAACLMQVIAMQLLVCCIQCVPCVGTGKLVCNKQKSVLTESILNVLSHTEINRDSCQPGPEKKCII